jgi:SprT protein
MEARKVLSKYLPDIYVDKVHGWLLQHKAVLRIAAPRCSKLGDYRPAQRGLPHRISVNHNLNHHEFLITLIHEMAHLLCWEKHGRRVRPHGKEWKLIFKDLSYEFLEPGTFPEDIQQALDFYFLTATSNLAGNENLKRVLQKYDPGSEFKMLEDIHEGNIFLYRKRVFKKVCKVRKRYQCFCLSNNRLYSFSPLARVMPATA